MSNRYGGACGLLMVLSVLAIVAITVSILTPNNSVLVFAVVLVLFVVLMPVAFGSKNRSFRVVRRGGYSMDVQELDTSMSMYKARDNELITRVVIDPYTNSEHIISGAPDNTYRDACLSDWPFKSLNKRSGWIVTDEKGNDITNARLTSYQGIARIQSILPIEKYESTRDDLDTQDSKDEYSDMDRGVKFYD
ncbi:MAG: hypothetical protein ACFFED_13800 [Candidatus Thorarchaeota archaeon]